MKHSGKLIINSYPVYDWKCDNGRHPGNGCYRPLKLLLLERYGICYWCRISVEDIKQEVGKSFPDNAATIDHLIPSYERGKGTTVRKVLACHGCNTKRSKEQSKEARKIRDKSS